MNQSQQGFTLIEVMVAIMLMALVSLIAWRGLDSVTRADQHLQASTEQTEALLRVLNQLQRDLSLRASVELNAPNTAQEQADKAAGLAAVTVRSSDSKGFRLDVIRSGPSPATACNGCAGGSRVTPSTAPPPRHGNAIRCQRPKMAWWC